MNHKPLLSIVTSIYNGGEDVLAFFESISQQTYENIELIIIDDCSTETKTLEIIKLLQQKQINIKYPYKFIQNQKNLGVINSFQEGLKYASGEYFAFPESDDYVDCDFYDIIMNEIIKHQYDAVKGLLLCEEDKNNVVDSTDNDDFVMPLLKNIKLPLEITNSDGQILSMFMPDITYCWFHVFSKRILCHNSQNLNFLNAVKYGISETLYKKYNLCSIGVEKASFYHYKGHKQFINGGIYTQIGDDCTNVLTIEKSILQDMLNGYNKALKQGDDNVILS